MGSHDFTSIDRRDFIKLSGSAVAAGALIGAGASAGPRGGDRPRNILLIITDQQHIDTIAAGGCAHVRTPAMDWLKRRGVGFLQSYSANPVCSPARSSILTGRTSSETDVHVNGRRIRSGIPNLGQWFSQQTDYETVYAGKWHLPRTYTSDIPGFRVLNTGIGGFGYFCDAAVSRACEGYIRNRPKSKPFLMVASFMQPHDVCEWLRLNTHEDRGHGYERLPDRELPPLPDNFEYDKNEPAHVATTRLKNEPFLSGWSKTQWRYYRWSYYRNIEHVDAEIGRVIQALEQTGRADDTLIVLTSDHGEGMGHHQMVRKSILYDEAARVPMLFAWPGHIRGDETDRSTVVSHLDIMPTLCDLAGIRPPEKMRGASLRSVLEGPGSLGREFVVTESSSNTGRMVRTSRFKYVTYKDRVVEQLFDMRDDPGETRNLAGRSAHAPVLREHRKMLVAWESKLDVGPGVTNTDAWWYKR